MKDSSAAAGVSARGLSLHQKDAAEVPGWQVSEESPSV